MIKNETRIRMRPPKNDRERMIAALTSRDEDLFEDAKTGRVVVFGHNKYGEAIFLGDVAMDAFVQDGRALVEIVRFGNSRGGDQ